jgi:hypothetical protein
MRFAIQCTADVATRSVACDGPTAVQAMSSGRLVTGGQGSYVLLASTGTTYDGNAVFQTNVSLQNRSATPIGTFDGEYEDGTRDEGGGIRVFFANEPVVVVGTGTVTVTNPDSIMNITGPNQKAFIYEEMLEGGQTSALKNWQFNVPSTVVAFSFTVQVSANIPHLESILRYRQDGAGLNGISCATATYCFAVGNHGTIRSRNGASWVWTGTGTLVDMHGVHTLSSSFAMAVGDGGTALRWNGAYWKSTGATGTAASLRGVWCASTTDCFAVGNGSIVVRWNGATNTWSSATNGITNALDLYAIWGSAANDIYAAGNDGNLIHWNGATWSPIALATTADFRGIWGSGVADIYLVGGKTSGGLEGQIWRGTGPSAGDWTLQDNPTTADLEAVWGFGAANVFAVGAGGTTLVTINNGTTWTNPVSNATQPLEGVAGGGANLFLVGAGGTIVTSTNSGTSFGTTSTGSASNLNAVWGNSTSSVYAVGDNGTIVRWNGTRLTLQTSGTTQHLRAVWGSGSTNVFAVGDGGTVLNSVNSGTTWTPVNLGTTANFRGIWGTGSTNIYVVGDVGTVYQWNGTIWSPVAVPANKGPGPARNLNAVWARATDDVYIVGDTGVIIHWDGVTWAQQPYETGFPQDRDIRGVWGSGASDVWAVARHTVILHNNGVTDTIITPPDTIVTNGGLDTTIIEGDTLAYNGPWDHMNMNGGADLQAVSGTGVGNVFAVSDSGEVFHQNNQLLGPGNGSAGYWYRMTRAGPDFTAIRGVWAGSLTSVFLVGDRGLFIRGVR